MCRCSEWKSKWREPIILLTLLNSLSTGNVSSACQHWRGATLWNRCAGWLKFAPGTWWVSFFKYAWADIPDTTLLQCQWMSAQTSTWFSLVSKVQSCGTQIYSLPLPHIRKSQLTFIFSLNFEVCCQQTTAPPGRWVPELSLMPGKVDIRELTMNWEGLLPQQCWLSATGTLNQKRKHGQFRNQNNRTKVAVAACQCNHLLSTAASSIHHYPFLLITLI